MAAAFSIMPPVHLAHFWQSSRPSLHVLNAKDAVSMNRIGGKEALLSVSTCIRSW